MKAIIIQDHDAKALLDKLKLESMQDEIAGYGIEALEAWRSFPPSVRKAILERLHRKFHYHVCNWLQEQGATVT
jgi:hypothetical protein